MFPAHLLRIDLFAAPLLTIAAVVLASTAANAAPPPPEDVPPWWPDERYVARGCYVSAAAYIERLRSLRPEAKARPAAVMPPTGKLHTIVVIELAGRIYGRDQYIGVFPIRRADVQQSYERALAEWTRAGGRHAFVERLPQSASDVRAETLLAREILGSIDSQLLVVPVEGGEAVVLTWLTPEAQRAFYEPRMGTAVGPDDPQPARIAAALLARHLRVST